MINVSLNLLGDIMVDTFPWLQEVFNVLERNNVVSVLNYRRNFLNTIVEIRLIFL